MSIVRSFQQMSISGARTRFSLTLIASKASSRWFSSVRVRLLLVMALAAVLCVLSAIKLARAVATLLTPEQVDYVEPIIYGQVSRIIGGQALYQAFDHPPYTITAYMPLYYWIAAGFRLLFGEGFVPGRMASMLAGVIAVALVFRLTTKLAHHRAAGAFASLLFVGLGFGGTLPWFALYRVDTVGVACSLAAVTVLAEGVSPRRIFLAACLAGLALLTKQTFVAAALAGTLWLSRDGWRRPALFGVTALLVAGIPSAVLEVTTHAFIANTLISNLNPPSVEQFEQLVPVYFARQALPMVIALLYLVHARPQAGAQQLLSTYLGTSSLSLLALFNVGAGDNYWLELAAPTAVLATLGIWSASREVAQKAYPMAISTLVVVLIAQSTVAMVRVHPTWNAANGQLAEVSSTNRADFERLVDRVRIAPGTVLAEPMDVLVLAGRAVPIEAFTFAILERQGRWSDQELLGSVCSGQVSLLVLGYPIDFAANYAPLGYPWWPPSVIAALRQTMQLESIQSGRFVYARASSSALARCQ